MFDKIELFNMSQAMARHAAARQDVAAQNTANADTPGYLARDLADFADSYQGAGGALRQTRPGHLGTSPGQVDLTAQVTRNAMSPNGNAVSLEDEMVKSVAARREHDLALAIYKSSLGILRSSLGRR
ncbi:FlgB family protein [Paracoccus sp. p4-l81]|uniref:FlgB family protein n=1 Tax=unclassified Paracoccus (in: a-proteobacteria) TaxID=2688777 RepID=UPI0035B78EEF